MMCDWINGADEFMNMNEDDQTVVRVGACRPPCMAHLPRVSRRLDLNHFYKVWRSDYATSETSFEAKAYDEIRSGVGRRRIDFFTGGRRIRSSRADNGRAEDAEHCAGSRQFTLGEEEIADVSLATFYVFDKENTRRPRAAYR